MRVSFPFQPQTISRLKLIYSPPFCCSAFQKVMSVKHVQQVEFLAEAELILLLADNVS